MEEKLFDDYRKEYWFHVSNQNEIPIFGQVEKSIDTDLLYQLAAGMPAAGKDVAYLKEKIKENVDAVDSLRTLVGITDKRMYLELSYIFNKYKKAADTSENILGESVYSLKKHSVSYFKTLIAKDDEMSTVVLDVIADYLAGKGLLSILQIIKRLSPKEMNALVDNLLLPKEIQQEETKRRGHGVERELALLLHELNVSFLPVDRHNNPMGSPDPNVDMVNFELAAKKKGATWSMDLILKKDDAIKVLVQGLVHSSDPGQYGVNKSDETVSVKNGLDAYNAQHPGNEKELWGLVDGVGFIENPEDTIFKMLGCFDVFVQLKTLYKAALRLHQLGMVKLKAIRFDMNFYSEQEALQMFERYGARDIRLIMGNEVPEGREIQAGKAWIYV